VSQRAENGECSIPLCGGLGQTLYLQENSNASSKFMTTNLVTVLGPTASGKTRLAARLAYEFDGEIISADSRQVYREMDIGTGKDYDDYWVSGKHIRTHLIDTQQLGYEYNVYEFQRDALRAYRDILERAKAPILCGGTGLYLEAFLDAYHLHHVPPNPTLRAHFREMPREELVSLLRSIKPLHNTTDILDKERLMRAIEIAQFEHDHPDLSSEFPPMETVIIGIKFDREIIKKRITERLHSRLDSGLVAEVERLLAKGSKPETLISYGLEYKFITQYLIAEVNYDDMVEKLNIAIHQFSKRQMTWFRRMERKGKVIHWIDGKLSEDDKMQSVRVLLS
jgi:tRNA dimethylallyltransferase